jgi:hypothetical protein
MNIEIAFRSALERLCRKIRAHVDKRIVATDIRMNLTY